MHPPGTALAQLTVHAVRIGPGAGPGMVTAGVGRGVVFGWVDGLGGNEFRIPAGVELDVPTLAVHDDMMVFAEQAQTVLFPLIGTFSNPGGTGSCAR